MECWRTPGRNLLKTNIPITSSIDSYPKMRDSAILVIREVGVDTGGSNIQFAVNPDNGETMRIEINPRVSRSSALASKATGFPFAKIAAKVMVGRKLRELEFIKEVIPNHVSVKGPVFPFADFDGMNTLLGPEMLSTGEVMGIGKGFGISFAKSFLSVFSNFPSKGNVFISVHDRDKMSVVPLARKLKNLGFKIIATRGTQEFLLSCGIKAEKIFKIYEGKPNVIDSMKDGKIHLMINTPLGKESQYNDYEIRRTALEQKIPYTTTISAARSAVDGIEVLRKDSFGVQCLQEYYNNT